MVKPFKALVSIQVAHLLLFLCQLPETGPRIRVFDHGLPQTTKRRPLCRRFAPSSLRGNLGGTLPGKDKHQPILRLIMNKKKKDFMPKMPPSRKHFTEAHGNLCNNTITCCMCSCFNNHTVTLCLHPQSGLQGTSLQPPPWKFSKNVAKLLVTDMKSYIKSVMISDAIHVALTS